MTGGLGDRYAVKTPRDHPTALKQGTNVGWLIKVVFRRYRLKNRVVPKIAIGEIILWTEATA